MLDYSKIIADLKANRDALAHNRDALAAQVKALDDAIAGLVSLSEGGFSQTSPAPAPINTERLFGGVNPAKAVANLYRAASTYGQFSGRNVPAPPPPRQPNHGPVPPGANSDWVSIIASKASPYAIALAVLRAHEGPISSAQLNAAIGDIRKVKGGAGYTVLEPLQKARIIDGNNSAWHILNRSLGGILSGEYLWAEPENLNIYDWAAVRREAILILLTENDSLTNAAITKSLEKAKWLKATVTPHLVKADLRSLSKEELVRQNFETKAWSLVG